MFGPETCFPFRLSSTPAPGVLEALVEAARLSRPLVRIDVDGTGDVPDAPRDINALKDVSTFGLIAAPEVAERVLARWGDDCFLLVTLRVDAAAPLDDVQRVAQRVKANGGIVEFTIREGDAHLRPQLESLGPWRILDDDDEYRLRGGAVTIETDGHVEQHTPTGAKRSTSTIQSVGLASATAELGLDDTAFALVRGAIWVPWVTRLPEPNGQGEFVYYGGGSQGHAAWYKAELIRASFGFVSTEKEAYERWLRETFRVDVQSIELLAFAIYDPQFGLFPPGAKHAQRLALPPRSNASNEGRSMAAAFAAEIVNGGVGRVAQSLGLTVGEADPEETRQSFLNLPEQEREALLKRAAGLLASSIEIIGLCRLQQELRSRTVLVLLTLASPEARRTLKRLQDIVPDVAAAATRKLRSRSTRGRFTRCKDPKLREKFVREAITELREVFDQRGHHG